MRLSPFPRPCLLLCALVACGGGSVTTTEGTTDESTGEPSSSFDRTTTDTSTSEPTSTLPTTTDPTTDPSAPTTDPSAPAADPTLEPTTDTTGPTTDTDPATTDTDPVTTDTDTSTGTDPVTTDTDTDPGEAECGDGVVEGDEECDQGADNSDTGACTSGCKAAVCGDGLVGPGEACDDGNQVDDDECPNACVPHECGDGIFSPGEACDDSNGVNDDECSNACTLPACGDGIVQAVAGETCDAGANNSDVGACTLACQAAQCGDGLVWDTVEECDDGDDDDDDECSNDCAAATCADGQQNGLETGVDCGGPDCGACPVLLLLGSNTTKSVGGRFSGGAWTLQDIPAPSVDAPALAIADDQTGIGVIRYTKIGDPKDNQLQYVTWKAGVWLDPQQIGQNTTRAAPTISAVGNGAHVVFHGQNFQHYYAAFDGVGWNPAADAVGNFGPGPGRITTVGIEGLFVFHDGGDGNRLRSKRRNANWVDVQTVDPDTAAFDRQPALVTLSDGARALAVHALNASGQLRSSERVGGAWQPVVTVPDAQTTDPPALLATPNNGALLAFRGTDGKLYVATYTQGGMWSAPTLALGPGPTLAGSPALARGVGGAEVELVWLDGATKLPRHARRIGGVWGAPGLAGDTALERVTIASGP